MGPKDTYVMTNSVDPDLAAPSHSLPRSVCPKP